MSELHLRSAVGFPWRLLGGIVAAAKQLPSTDSGVDIEEQAVQRRAQLRVLDGGHGDWRRDSSREDGPSRLHV